MALTARQRRAFSARGYFVLGRIFDDGELVELGAAYDAILAHRHRRGVQPHTPTDSFFQVGYHGDATGVPCELAAGEVLIFAVPRPRNRFRGPDARRARGAAWRGARP